MKKILFTVLLGLLIVVALFVYSNFMYSGFYIKSNNLDLKINDCKNTFNDRVSLNTPYTFNQSWVNGVLVIDLNAVGFCNQKPTNGTFEINGDELKVKYYVPKCAFLVDCVVTECLCKYNLIYKISNLEKKDYIIKVMSE